MRMSSAAYWASWADALHMIAERQVADQVLAELAQDTNQGCIGELREAADRLDREGFVNRPEWIALKDVQRPEVVEMWELASGTTAGSTTRLLVPNTIIGRP